MTTPTDLNDARPGRLSATSNERLRYLVVGCWNTAFAYALFVALHRGVPSLHYMVVLVMTQVIGTLNAFITHRYFVFRVRGQLIVDLARFSLVYVGVFAFNLAALPLLVEGAGVDPVVVQGGILVMAVASSYLGHKHFSFRRSPKEVAG